MTVTNGCLLCGGDVRGNRESKYYCKKCNILFSHESLERAGKFKPQEGKAVVKARFVGSSTSNKYHTLECWLGKNIKPERRIYFATVTEAHKHGYVGCKKCVQPT